MSKQGELKAVLEKTGIPHKDIEVYGRQIVITSWSEDAANKWAHLLSQFAKVRGVIPAIDYAKKNKNTVMLPTTINVFRTFAVMR
jgi:uncharacterized membrane-anchored protein